MAKWTNKVLLKGKRDNPQQGEKIQELLEASSIETIHVISPLPHLLKCT